MATYKIYNRATGKHEGTMKNVTKKELSKWRNGAKNLKFKKVNLRRRRR